MTETSEQLFYALDQQTKWANGNEPILYFCFDSHDTTRNTLKGMLATFLGQMVCHHASRMNSWGQLLFEQLNEEHGWTDQDLLQWFSRCSAISFTKSAFLIIERFDECPKAGRETFVDWLYRTIDSEEKLWKVAITSRRPVYLPTELQGWKHVDLAITMTTDDRLDIDMQSVQSTELKSLLSRHRPELLNDVAWTQSINRISSGDTLVQRIMLEHSMSIPDWPRKVSVAEIFNLVGNEDSGDELLMRIVDSVLRGLSEKVQVRTMLEWLLYSARPLSLWEFTSIMYPECLNQHTCPEQESVREFFQICEVQLRGIIEIRDTTIRIRHPRLRELLTRPLSAGSPEYLWNDIEPARAAHNITKACLQFLARTDAQNQLESMIEKATLYEQTYEPFSGYTNLCSYATYYWPRHAALIPKGIGLSSLLKEYKRTAINDTWLKAYWCLENPVTRSRQPSESVDVHLASLGLPHSEIATWDPRSIVSATQRAATQGQPKMTKALLLRCEQSNSVLMDVLIAAASYGEEELLLHIMSQINTENGDSEALTWPPCLMYRAAWLGMDKFVKALLAAGCSPDPGGPMVQKSRVSPLHLATRHGHIATVELLLLHGADTEFKTRFDRNVFFTATQSVRPGVLKTLFKHGRVNLTALDKFNVTPLSFAAYFGRKAAIKSLLEIGADPHDGKDLTSPDIGRLPLIECSAQGHREAVRILLDSDADPNQPGPKGHNTAIWFAARNNYPEIVRALLEKGADPNHALLRPPILVSLVRKCEVATPANLDLIDLMVEFGARLDAADGEGRTALMRAIEAKDESAVAHLLDLGASVDTLDEDKMSPLHLAAYQGSETILNLILAKQPDLDCLDAWGRTALSRAVEFPNLARILLEEGANPDLTKYYGFTPLALSAEDGRSKTVEVLLDHGAQVNLQTDITDEYSGGWTAVCIAANYDHPDIVKMLLDAGALLSFKNNQGITPLHVATLSTARVLLQYRKRFNINQPTKHSMTALHCAIRWSESTEITKLLIDSGADLNLQDSEGDTPLGLACYLGNSKLVKILLQEADCKIDLASDYGSTPLHRAAARNESSEITELLVTSGADINQVGRSDVGSPLQAACRNAKAGNEIIEYLLDHGANLHAQVGTLGFAISTAALSGTPEIIRLLLQRGATVNVADAMSRTPIHISCVGGSLNFQEIYKAGGNHNLRAKDRLERTVFHWAAQHGSPDILEDLIAELGTELINEPDIDGWTPLLWASWPGKLKGLGIDSRPAKTDDEREQRQSRVFRILLGNGARPDVTGKIGECVWSLREVALFNEIKRSCLQQVEDALTSIAVKPALLQDITDPNKGRVGALMDTYCDACYYVSDS